MIEYLEQLERDLVDAVDRREALGRSRRRTPGLRRLRVSATLATTIAVLALSIAIVALVRQGPEPVAPPSSQPPSRGAPIPPGTPLRISGDVTRRSATSWRGSASGPGGTGILELTGKVAFTSRSRQIIRFRWSATHGVLTGCADITIARRPHARWLWDGPAHVTTATSGLRRYQGSHLDFAGATPVSDTRRAHIGIQALSRPRLRC